MKRKIYVILSLLLAIALLSGCGAKSDTSSEESVIRLGGLKGPTSMGLVKLLDNSEKNLTENKYKFTMEASADALTPSLLKGELDIISVPANLAAVLYNNSKGAVNVFAVNTLGVLYITEKGGNSINSLKDIKGKTILATGKGTTPEYVLAYLLEKNGIDINKDVSIKWKSEPSEIVAEMSTVKNAVAMLPQPFVAVAQGKLGDLHIAVDLTDEWEKLSVGSSLVTSVLITRKDFAEKNSEKLSSFIREYRKSTDFVNENTADAALLVEKYGIVNAEIAEKAIPYCHIVCITGAQMKTELEKYLTVLYDRNAKSVGGKMPNGDFYIDYE